MEPNIELLAPAGSAESLRAAVNAGADAVYMGSTRFGARAYADNPDTDSFIEAMDYAHLHGRKVYLTVNTLLKEEETGELYSYLKPFYEAGIDAVIVQDYGALLLIRKWFPDLPVHASTQMTVTGKRFASELKKMGVTRLIPARELSLSEISAIAGSVDIELECFVHGALCYCYSGQCLLSSLIGGRSGNRGRCAQPCRLPYSAGSEKDEPLLSMKDLETLMILPDIIEAGVTSLKIEGRMKSPRYTAGVVSVYRRYLDRLKSGGRKDYKVLPEDLKALKELFDRGGTTEGYFYRHNGKDMIALGPRPDLRETDQDLISELDRKYVTPPLKIPLDGQIIIHEGEDVFLAVTDHSDPSKTVNVKGPAAATAKTQPLSAGQVLAQIRKTGGSIYYFEELTCDMEGSCFMPVSELNELRRRGLKAFEDLCLGRYRRSGLDQDEDRGKTEEDFSAPLKRATAGDGISSKDHYAPALHVSVEDIGSLDTVLSFERVDEVCLDSATTEAGQWKSAADRIHRHGKKCALIFPAIFRTEAEAYFNDHLKELKEADFDEFIVRSLEEPGFLREHGTDIPVVFDSNIYMWNKASEEYLTASGASRLTLPVELNSRELSELDCSDKELIVYGRIPVMFTAQCVRRTVSKCDKKPGCLYMKDRTGRSFPVKNICRFCYNTIYNPMPLTLLGEEEKVRELSPAVIRLSFTTESPERVKEVLDAFQKAFCEGVRADLPFKEYTRGHFNRGVG